MSKKKTETQNEEDLIQEVRDEKNQNSNSEEKEEKNEPKKPEDEAIETKYLRLMADFQNYKRRVEKEKTDIYAFANEKIALELLDVIDNFERALSHQGEEDDTIVEGMNKIYKQLKGVLERNGLLEIEALGKDFDPNFHNGVMTGPSDEYDSGKVADVMQKGYILNSKVIRHSMVKVAE